jgi:hypothetical protein
MLRLQRLRTQLGWSDRLMTLQGKVNARRDALDLELRELNAAWEKAPEAPADSRRAALPLERLEELSRATSYVTRWTAQIQERLSQLAA